jgi:hypothetical protein
MATDPLQSLREAFINAGNPVSFNAAFIAGAGATAPAGFDAMLKAAFVLPAAPVALGLTIDKAGIGPISGDSFTISRARLAGGFLAAPEPRTDATLTFTLPDPSAAVEVQIVVALANWQPNQFFPAVGGWPFTLLQLAATTFAFTTVAKAGYRWGGSAVELAPGQNLLATMTVPAAFTPIFELVEGLDTPAGQLTSFGPITLDKAVNVDDPPDVDKDVWFPDMDLIAPIAQGTDVKVFFLTARAPMLGFRIATSVQRVSPDSQETAAFQTPEFYFGLTMDIELAAPAGTTATLNLRAALISGGALFNFTLLADPESPALLSPATVAASLMNGNSYFQYVPPPLQAMLSTVGFKGLALAGPLQPRAGLSSAGIMLGSAAGQPLVLFGDPSNGQTFTIESVDLSWTILNPLVATARRSLVQFTTTFTLWPKVFRTMNGEEGGLFRVQIDQAFNINAGFEGKVSMDDLLREITGGAVGMPEGVSVDFSNVALSLRPSQKAYAFSFEIDAAVDFISFGGKPLLQFQGMTLALAAMTPTATGAQRPVTVYRGSIGGVVGIGPLLLSTFVEYDGTTTPRGWTLHTSLAEALDLGALIRQLFDDYQLPGFLPIDLTVETFSIDAQVPSKVPPPAPQPRSSYQVQGSLRWKYDGIPNFPIDTRAQLGLQFDGNKPVGQQFSGSAIGELRLDAVGVDVMVGYSFGPAALVGGGPQPPGAPPTSNQTLWIQWQGFRATYNFTQQTIAFSLKGYTIGSLIQTLVRTLPFGDPYFTLESPWDLLNQISLDGLSVVFDLKPNVTSRISAKYALPRPINLGFLTIKGVTLQKVIADGREQVTLAIDGTTAIPGMQNTPLFNPNGPGQDVQNMPPVPGRGSAWFDLRLLAMGQRVGIRDYRDFKTTKELIAALEGIPPTRSPLNPVQPKNPNRGQPFYDPAANWLVALDFGLLGVPAPPPQNVLYTFELMVAFNDPNLYALRLALNGEKASVLAGLAIDILYKKITDDIGLYAIDFSFPSALRNLDFGAFSIVLPNIGIQIYTNGDFLIDFGFPYNLDFSRSFTVQAIVYGVPVLGSAGFYFGKLSNATASRLPRTTKGTFDPVIVFGFGAQLGVGRYFEKGPLKAGFSITVFGIIEGVIAPWHPYDASGAPSDSKAVQGNYYFWLQGQFGIIGKLYGTVDFAIVKADVNLLVQLVVKITYESFRAIPLSISAHVSIRVSLKIDLGLFSITINFSFATTIRAELTIGANRTAPWDEASRAALLMRRLDRIAPAPPASVLRGRRAALRFKPVARVADDTKPKLTLAPAPQFSVVLPDVTKPDAASQQGAFVFLLAMDAPTADGDGNQDGSSFQSLCELLLPWVIDSLANPTGAAADLAALADTPVTKAQLELIMDALADNERPPVGYDDIIRFLSTGFDVDIAVAGAGMAAATAQALQAGATIFPPFTELSLIVPAASGAPGTTVTIPLGGYVSITDEYRRTIAAIFREVAARVQEESGDRAPRAGAPSELQSITRFVFEDYFLLIARQLVQASLDALNDFAFELGATGAVDSISSILDWAVKQGNEHMIPADVVEPNLEHGLDAGNKLSIAGVSYTVQAGDSVTRVAQRYTDSGSPRRYSTAPAEVITANRARNDLILPGVDVPLPGHDPYRTKAGDSFDAIAAGLDVDISVLAADSTVQSMSGLLAPSIPLAVPPIAYTTAAGDTLQSVLTRFAVPLQSFLDVPENLAVPHLFDAADQPTIALAHLDSLPVSDLWRVIVRTDQIAQTAGMAARYPLSGVRLPNVDGLSLPPAFLYPAGQPDYGIYQLTGQEFPTPTIAPGATYGITLTKDPALTWLELDGDPTTTELPVDLTPQAQQLQIVVDHAKSPGYDPRPTLAVQPATEVDSKRFAVPSATRWSTSDQALLAALTAPPPRIAEALTEAADAPQVQPIIWAMPEAMLRLAEARAAALAEVFDVKASLPYIPVFAPRIGVTDPATGTTSYTPATKYAFATAVQFQIRRLAQADDLAPQSPFENGVVPPNAANSGAAARPLAPFTYELIGPGPADAILLERILTAMDSQGEGMVAGLFLLYPDNASAPTGLVSRGSQELLSFITQTNLSTETNPPPQRGRAAAQGDNAPPRGIANGPAELIKLIWELSTVRSGGYYLYYEIPDQGVGLPDGLFDVNGVAQLSLMVLYDRAAEPASGGRLANYVNACVTVEAIDLGRAVMTMESESGQSTTPALGAGAVPRDLAALYGVSLGQLVALNADTALAPSSEIPIQGVIHQVTQADVASGDVPARLAQIYSVGAKQPLTAAQVVAYNPGVLPALLSVYRIPAITYVVSAASGGPGDRLSTIMRYYGLTSFGLGWLIADVRGLLPAGTALRVDTRILDVQPALGVGNIGVDLQRDNLGTPPDLPPDPTPEQKAEFARAYLFSLFTMMTAGVAKNAFFGGSRPGVAFGPQQRLSDPQVKMLRRPHLRRALLQAAADEPFHYRQALGYGAFSRVNPAPDPARPGLPPRAANPYVGVGTLAQIDLQWSDVFGNRVVTPFNAPLPAGAGPLNDPPAPIQYVDRLIGLEQWPNVRAYHRYGGAPGQPQLEIVLELNTAAYEPSADEKRPCQAAPDGVPFDDLPVFQQTALNDLYLYTRLYFQLNQSYDGLNIPGLAGRAIAMSIANTLLAQPERPLSAADEQRIRDFVADCLVYVNNRAHCQPGGEQPTATLVMPVAIADVAAENIIPLALSLTMTRQAMLSDPALRTTAGGLSATTAIQPFADVPQPSAQDTTAPPPQNLAVFAAAVERVFDAADWRLRVGTGTSDPSAPRATGGVNVWAVRMGKRPGVGLFYTLGSTASFYAPQPVATALMATSLLLQQYKSGQPYPYGDPVEVTFTGVDMNVWTSSVLTAIDAFLTPTFTSPTFIVDQLTIPDPNKDGYLAKILRHKESLAAAISRTMRPILSTSATDEESRNAARDKMLQALLAQLANAYTVTAIAVVPVTDASTNEPARRGTVAQPRFFGQLQASTPAASLPAAGGGSAAGDRAASDDTGEQNFSLSSGKISLPPSGAPSESRLAFLFSSKNVPAQRFVSLDLAYAMTHLEHDIRNVPGIQNYEQSAWITFVTGPFSRQIGTSPIDLPVLLRELPTPPSVTAQTAAPAVPTDSMNRTLVTEAVTPIDLALWEYGFSYLHPGSAQDSLTATVDFNLASAVARFAADPQLALFAALAQFISVYPAIARDLDTYLLEVTGASKPDEVTDAALALSALEQIAQGVAQAYEQWASAQAVQRAAMAARVTYVFDIDMRDDAGDAVVDILNVSIPPAIPLPVPVVLIDPATYMAQPVSPPPGVLASYKYLRKPTPAAAAEEYLTFREALEIPGRAVSICPLNLFGFQDAWSAIQAFRNRRLVPGAETTAWFQFSTPKVRFAEPIVPLSSFESYDLGSVGGGPSLEGYLDRFFELLLQGATGQQITVTLGASYAYVITPTIKDLPSTVLPVKLLPPTSVVIASGTPPSFIAPFANAVMQWLRDHQPTLNATSRLSFSLAVFAGGVDGGAPGMPLLQIKDLYIDANAVQLAGSERAR